MRQGASGVDISYAYVYLFSKWLTPGEVLFFSFRKLPPYFIDKILVTGYNFYERDLSFGTGAIKDTRSTYTHYFSANSHWE